MRINNWNTAKVCNDYDVIQPRDFRDYDVCKPIWILISAKLTQDANYPWHVELWNFGQGVSKMQINCWRVPSIYDSVLYGHFAP